MADEGINFAIRFNDQMSGPLKAIQAQLTTFESSLKQANSALKENASASGQAAGGMGEAGSAAEAASGSMFGAVAAGELLAHAIMGLADAAWRGAKALFSASVETVDFGYKAQIAFTSMTGSAQAGKEAFEEAERTARDLAEPIDSVTTAMLGLRSAGIKEDWIRPLIAGAHDLTVINPRVTFTQAAQALQEVALQGGLAGRTIEMLRSAGVNLSIVASHLGAHSLKELQEQLNQKPLGLYEGMRVIEDVIKEQAGESALGGVSIAASKTISGSIQKIKDNFESMLDSVNAASEGPFASIRESLSSIADDFDSATPQGKRFAEVIAHVASGIAGILDRISSDPEMISRYFDKAVSGAEHLWNAMRLIVDVGEELAKVFSLGAGIAGGAATGAAIGSAAGPIGTVIGAIGGGISGFFGAKSVDESFINALPHHAAGGVTTHEHLAVVGEVPEAIIPLDKLGSMGGGISLSVNVGGVHVDGGKVSEDLDEQRLAELLTEMLPEALISPLEKLAATAGAM